nr:tail protein X [Providencia alcalifaciens]
MENLAETVIGVLEHNPGLADKGAIYSAGIRITLPQLTQSVVTAPYSLWD